MKRLNSLVATGVWLMTTAIGCGQADEGAKQEASALRFRMKLLDGKDVDLARYEGKVVLVVNVASKCGYTPQYEQLQKLHEEYAEEGLAILAFPCNQFLWQEPGSAEEIGKFCRVNYGVEFDVFAKVDVKGPNACELYRLITSLNTRPKGPGKIGWNFEKFVLNRDGFVVARFGSATKPDALEIVSVIERELAAEPGSGTAGVSPVREQPKQFDLADYRWKNRIMLLFAPGDNHSSYESFLRAWNDRAAEVSERDLLLIRVLEDRESRIGDTQLSGTSAARLRDQFQVDPDSMILILVGKDGGEKLRRPALGLDELFATIDAMPMRRREMAEQQKK
jgi:glutathione peroxidase